MPNFSDLTPKNAESEVSLSFEKLAELFKDFRDKHGLTIEEHRRKNGYFRELLKPKIAEMYGELSESDISTVIQAWRILAECEGCTGECKKSAGRWSKPVIRHEFGHIYTGVAYCEFGQKRFERREFKRAGIPEKFCDKTLSDFKKSAESNAAMDVYRRLIYPTGDEKKGAYFYGGCGTGKTFLAALIAQEFVRDFKRVIFRDMPSLLTDIKSTFDSKESTAGFLDSLCDCDLLVLDDLGAEKVTDWSVEQLYLIVNRRYSAGKTLVATANFDLDGLAKRLSGEKGDPVTAKRIISRLREMTSQAFFGTHDWRN